MFVQRGVSCKTLLVIGGRGGDIAEGRAKRCIQEYECQKHRPCALPRHVPIVTPFTLFAHLEPDLMADLGLSASMSVTAKTVTRKMQHDQRDQEKADENK